MREAFGVHRPSSMMIPRDCTQRRPPSPKVTMSQDVLTRAPYRYAVGVRAEPGCSEQGCIVRRNIRRIGYLGAK
jgi:hypothetical protein